MNNMAEVSCDEIKEAYNQGLNDAWELVRKIMFTFSQEEKLKIFGIVWNGKIFDFTPHTRSPSQAESL